MEDHIVVRTDRSLKNLLETVSKARGETPSSFVRRAILTELARLSYLSESEKKALGLFTITAPKYQGRAA